MYQQYQQPSHQPHGGQISGFPNRDSVDPFEVRQHYRNELATLTFNSKPIITSLTIAAEENISVSKIIVQTIEERIRTAPPSQKLPALYLIDSIIKNVGGPYLNLFSRTIVTIFLDAYQVVDSAAKTSFEKVLGTWPNWASQLFSRDIVSRIEQGVQSLRPQKLQHSQQTPPMFGNSHFPDRLRDNSFNPSQAHGHGQGTMYGRNDSAGPQSRTPFVPSDSRADNVLLQEIQLLMLQKQREIVLNPGDQASTNQVAILQQVRAYILGFRYCTCVEESSKKKKERKEMIKKSRRQKQRKEKNALVHHACDC